MDKEKSLKIKDEKIIKTPNSQKKFNNNKKLDINLSSYYKLTKKNNKFKKNISIFKTKNHNSTEIKDNHNKDSILYKKFLEFKFNNKSQKKANISNQKSKKKYKYNNSNKSFSSFSSNLKETNNKKSKTKNNKNKENKENKENINLKNSKNKINYKNKKDKKILNKTELFNNIINNNNEKEEKNNEKRYNTLKNNKSCQNFNNNNLIKDFEIKDNIKNNIEENQDDKEIKKKTNMTLNLISKTYFEKMKFNKYKYYNEKNKDYIKERRQRIEDKMNEILYEKYKIIRPLRMTERKFQIEDESKNDKNNNNNNKNNFDNNMCKILKGNNLNNLNYNIYYFMNNFKDNNIENKNEENSKNYNQIIYYNNKINDISKMRKYLSIEDFFGDFRRDYNLLDFNFTFLFHNFKK